MTATDTASNSTSTVTPAPLVANPVNPTDSLSLFLVQIVIILILVRILAKLLGKLRQPPVIGEIIAGILLGPTAFGYIPNFSNTIFPQSSLTVINVFAQVGLIFFMFFLGLEVDVSLLTRNWKAAAPVAVISIICPFCVGIGISYWFYDIEPTSATQSTFLLFMGTSLAFTAFPVLARILTSYRLLNSGVGVHALSIAAIDDVFAWCVLAITLSYAGGGSAINGLYTMLIVIAFVVVLVFVVRPFLLVAGKFFFERTLPGDEFNRDYVALLFFLLACAAIWTEIIGVHAFFGAFAFGIIVPKEYGLVEYLAPKIELLVVEFFLPLYFANSGLQTSLGDLNSGELWGKAIALIVLATVAKLVPVMLVTRLTSLIFFVDTADPDDELPATAAPSPQHELDSDGAVVDDGKIEVGPELEMAEIIAKQHAAITKQARFADADKHEVELKVVNDREDSVRGAPNQISYDDPRLSPSAPVRALNVEESKEHDPELVVDEGEREISRISRRSRSKLNCEGVDTDGRPLSSSSVTVSGAHTPTSSNANSSESIAQKPQPLSWRVCFVIGVLMNTRGLVALIALNIGKSKGILGPRVFSLMVLMALVTTFITSPVFEYVFYRPYMAERRMRREARRREEDEQRRLERQGTGLSPDDAEETEAERLARRRKEEEEDERSLQDEINRMSIMVHTYNLATPRVHTSQSPRALGFFGSSALGQSTANLLNFTQNSPITRPESLTRARTMGSNGSSFGSSRSVSHHQLPAMLQTQPAALGHSITGHTRSYHIEEPHPHYSYHTTQNTLMATGPARLNPTEEHGSIEHLNKTGPSHFGVSQHSHRTNAVPIHRSPRSSHSESPPPFMTQTAQSRVLAIEERAEESESRSSQRESR